MQFRKEKECCTMINDKKNLLQKCESYLKKLCIEIPGRAVGTEGNRMATKFFRDELGNLGWNMDILEFEAMDWDNGGATLHCDEQYFDVFVSPYSLGCSITAELVSAENIEQLEKIDCNGKILLVLGELTKEQLIPKNFVFYNPEEHQRIVARLERCGASAIVCATGHNGALAGGAYPFPLIEDGDFNVPSVYMKDVDGVRLKEFVGRKVSLHSDSNRLFGKGYNVAGKKGDCGSGKIVISAHIDAKKESPGAIDNATGITVILLLAELLKDYHGKYGIELVAFNGEDYYAVPGQMMYINANQYTFNDIMLNINIDGAGFKEGKTAFSLFDLPENFQKIAIQILKDNPDIVEGPQWPQGDHSIFVQYGRPAIAVSSDWFIRNMESQQITHTPKDNLSIVDMEKVVGAAAAIRDFIMKL